MAQQYFAGDFALSRLQFLKENFAGSLNFGTFWKQNQTTTLGATFSRLCEKCVNSWTSPENQYRGDTGDGAYGVSSLPEKLTRFGDVIASKDSTSYSVIFRP